MTCGLATQTFQLAYSLLQGHEEAAGRSWLLSWERLRWCWRRVKQPAHIFVRQEHAAASLNSSSARQARKLKAQILQPCKYYSQHQKRQPKQAQQAQQATMCPHTQSLPLPARWERPV